MFSTYKVKDVTLLLKDITGLIEPLPAEVREPLIQAGTHYSEMLPLEYVPTKDYLMVYEEGLRVFSDETARAVGVLAKKIYEDKGQDVTLVSLARAGISIGILLKRYLSDYFNCDVPHYAISIIRGKGIDNQALDYIIANRDATSIQFVDGWTGKGAVQSELKRALTSYPGVDYRLAVLSDPANVTPFCGTKSDFLIPSSCLNATVSGLISRTFCRNDIIGPSDYHGAAFYKELTDADLTYAFIDEVVSKFERVDHIQEQPAPAIKMTGIEEARAIASAFKISDINLIKPGIGETTRVLLRRVPWKILVDTLEDRRCLGQIYQLAKEKDVPLEIYPLHNYRACGLIRELADS